MKPYRKYLENKPSGATEAKRKNLQTSESNHFKKGNLKPCFGYSWLPDRNREEIAEWRSKYNLPLDVENI